MSLLRLSWKNLTSKPWSMLLSVVLFALGTGLISLLFLLEKQLQDKFESNLAGIDLVIGAKGSPLQLILSSMYHIDAPTGNISIEEIRPFLNPRHPLIEQAIPLSLGDSYRSYRIVGTTHDILDLYNAEIGQGHIWKNHFEVTIGAEVSRATGLEISDTFRSSHGFMDEDHLEHADAEAFNVVGILQPTGTVIDQLILCTTQTFWMVHEHEEETGESEDGPADNDEHADHDHEGHDHDDEDHEHEHSETDDRGSHDHDDGDHTHEAGEMPVKSLLEEDPSKEITSLLVRFKAKNYQALNMQRSINENTDMQAATPAIEINRLFSLMDAGEQALRLLAIVIIFVSGLSIFISLYSSLRDRKYELALMRVSGGSPRQLFMLIILEGLLLAGIGCLVGLILSHGGMEMIASYMESSYRYTFTGLEFLDREVWLVVGAMVIGFLAAVIPAVQASRTDIAETLTSGK